MKNAARLLCFLVAASVLSGPERETSILAQENTVAAPPRRAGSRRRSVFTAKFQNVTGDKQYDPAAAGMGDLVSAMLSQSADITFVERQRVEALTDEQARSLAGLTGTEYAVRAGKLLKADTVLTGRLFLIETKLTVSVRAIDIASERVVAADQISCRPSYLMEAALQAARQLAKQMALPLPKIDPKQIDHSPIAGLHFGKALSHYYTGDMDAALMQLMRTLDLDPDFIEAHFWAGMCYSKLGEDDGAIIEWRKFLKRSPPQDNRAAGTRKLILEAEARLKDRAVERLAPEPPKRKIERRESTPRGAAQ